MKNLILSASIIISSYTMAAKPQPILKCWNAYFINARVPYLSAVIEQDNVLSNIRFHYKNNEGKIPSAPAGQVAGELITNNRSPYKGMNDFYISTEFYGAERLILPVDLSNENLLIVSKSHRNRENGVVIGSFDGDGTGSHFSIRLVCTSNK